MQNTTIESVYDNTVKEVHSEKESKSWVSKNDGTDKLYLDPYKPFLKFYNRKNTHKIYPSRRTARIYRVNKNLVSLLPKKVMPSKDTHGYIAKDIHYKVMLEIALQNGIKGNAAILGGTRQAEILVNFLPVLKNKCFFIEKDNGIWKTFKPYVDKLITEYEIKDKQAKYINDDIIAYLSSKDMRNNISIIDLDLCGILHIEHEALPTSSSVANAIINASAQKSIVSITSYNGRKPKNELKRAGKLLLTKLNKEFEIKDHFAYQYWEGSPMETKILVLERKS